MRVALWPLSLSRRIVASVALGLGLILLMFGLVSLWTVGEATQTAYGERVAFAQALATRVDDVLRYSEQALGTEADQLGLEPGQPLDQEQQRQLASFRLRFESFVVVSVSDVDGANTWTEPPSAAAEFGSPLQQESVRLVASTGRAQIAEVTSPSDPRRPLACIAVPVRDSNGQLFAVVMADLDPTHPSLGILPSKDPKNSVSAEFLSGDAAADSPYTAEHRVLLANLIRTRTAGYRIHYPGPGDKFPTHVVAYAPVSELPSWGITVEQPQDVALAMPRQLELRLALSGILALLLGATVAWLDVRRVVGPLKRLTATAEHFAAGQLDEPVRLDHRLDRSDELDVLAHAFETMRQQLRASLAEVAAWNRAEAALEERERIAHEMHDGLGQVLGYVNTKTLAVARLLDVGKVEEARTQVGQLEAVAKEVSSDVREAILGLRTTLGPDQDFLTALREYLEGYERQSGIEVKLEVDVPEGRLGPQFAAEIQFLRIAQEALTNVRKHAQARHAVVRLLAMPGELCLVVEDDGQGFDPAHQTPEGWPRFGLKTMRERAIAAGGSLRVESRVGGGTRVVACVPQEQQEVLDESASSSARR